MSLDKLKEKKNDLQEAIAMLLEDFEKETNLKVTNISLNIDEYKAVNSKDKRLLTVDVDIEM